MDQSLPLSNPVKKTDKNDAKTLAFYLSSGTGKVIIALVKKFSEIIDQILSNDWVFLDFPNFVLAKYAS